MVVKAGGPVQGEARRGLIWGLAAQPPQHTESQPGLTNICKYLRVTERLFQVGGWLNEREARGRGHTRGQCRASKALGSLPVGQPLPGPGAAGMAGVRPTLCWNRPTSTAGPSPVSLNTSLPPQGPRAFVPLGRPVLSVLANMYPSSSLGSSVLTSRKPSLIPQASAPAWNS